MDPRERINDNDEAARAALDGRQARIRTALPGLVTAVDLTRQTLSVQPAIQGQVDAPDGTVASVNLPVLVDVPIVWPRAGGYAVTFPIKIGDEVLVVFGDRCIDAWWQSGGIGVALEARMHDLSDAFAIPGPTSQPKRLSNVSSTAVQVRNEAGDSYIEITDAKDINLVSARDVTVTAARDFILNATARNMQTAGGIATISSIGLLTLTSAGGLTFAGTGGSPVSITSGPVTWNPTSFALNSAGGITFTGSAGGMTHNGKNVGDTHTHGGVTTGGGNTGVPV